MTDKTWVNAARGRSLKVISWLLKELPADNNYKVIFMQRDLNEILASQAKMLQRRDETNDTNDEKMLEIYEDHLWKVRYLCDIAPTSGRSRCPTAKRSNSRARPPSRSPSSLATISTRTRWRRRSTASCTAIVADAGR